MSFRLALISTMRLHLIANGPIHYQLQPYYLHRRINNKGKAKGDIKEKESFVFFFQ